MFRLRIHTDLGFEVWQDIPDYEGLYQASTYGCIRGLSRIRKVREGIFCTLEEKILKQSVDTYGYRTVDLCKNGRKTNFKAHQLIAKTFLFNPYNYRCVNHKDECKTNNNVSNLEFCTYLYNNRYGTRSGRIAKAQSKPVFQYDKDGNFIKEWKSAKEYETITGKCRCCIYDVCKGKQKTAYGYIWKFKEDA